jgi:hypothetical protein
MPVCIRTLDTDAHSALIGFLLALHPLSMTLMGWRGAGGGGAASIGWYYFAGGMLMVLGGIGEVRTLISLPLALLTLHSGSSATPFPLSSLPLSAPSGSVSLPPCNPSTMHMAPLPTLRFKAAPGWSLLGLTSVLVRAPLQLQVSVCISNSYYSILPHHDGHPLPCLPRLLHPHQPNFLPHLLHSRPRFRAARW